MDRASSQPWPTASRLLARYQYAVAAADQVALSLFGFGLNFCLLRVLSPSEFGIVSLWMAVSLLAISVQGALVAVPLSVHVAAADLAVGRRLEGALAGVNLIVVLLAGAAVAAAATVSRAEWAAATPLVALAIVVFVISGLCREYYRAVAFGRRDVALLLAVDVPYLAVTGFCLAAMLIWPDRLAGLAAAFFAIALGGGAGQLCARFASGGPATRPFRRGWIAAYRAVAGEALWALLGGVAMDLQNRSYVYIITGFTGVAGLGAINAVGVLFRPARILLTAWGRSALPQLARLAAERQAASFDRALLGALAVGGAASAVVYAMLWFAWQPIAHYVLADKYPDAAMLLLPWALASGISVVDYIIGVGLQALRQFKYLAQTALLGVPLNAAATIAAVWWHGYGWAMYGVAFGTCAVVLMQGTRLLAVRRKLSSASVAEASAGPPGALAEGGEL